MEKSTDLFPRHLPLAADLVFGQAVNSFGLNKIQKQVEDGTDRPAIICLVIPVKA
jgi:hypothetical protein